MLPICIYVEQCCNCVWCCHFGQWEIQLALVSKKVEVHHLLQNFSCPGGQPLHSGLKSEKIQFRKASTTVFLKLRSAANHIGAWSKFEKKNPKKFDFNLLVYKFVFALFFHFLPNCAKHQGSIKCTCYCYGPFGFIHWGWKFSKGCLVHGSFSMTYIFTWN